MDPTEKGFFMTTVIIKDDAGEHEYLVQGRIVHHADTLTTHTMFGFDPTERRCLHTLQFVSED